MPLRSTRLRIPHSMGHVPHPVTLQIPLWSCHPMHRRDDKSIYQNQTAQQHELNRAKTISFCHMIITSQASQSLKRNTFETKAKLTELKTFKVGWCKVASSRVQHRATHSINGAKNFHRGKFLHFLPRSFNWVNGAK